MKTVIWKYQLKITGQQTIEMPYEHNILSVAEQNGVLCMWVEVNPDAYLAEPGAYVMYVSTRDAIAKNRAAMIAFQKAVLESNALLNRADNENSFREITAEVTGVSLDAAKKLRLPIMIERKVSFTDMAYLPRKLKAVGILKKRVDLTPILFW